MSQLLLTDPQIRTTPGYLSGSVRSTFRLARPSWGGPLGTLVTHFWRTALQCSWALALSQRRRTQIAALRTCACWGVERPAGSQHPHTCDQRAAGLAQPHRSACLKETRSLRECRRRYLKITHHERSEDARFYLVRPASPQGRRTRSLAWDHALSSRSVRSGDVPNSRPLYSFLHSPLFRESTQVGAYQFGIPPLRSILEEYPHSASYDSSKNFVD